ncbi:MAG TPA: hypothetical protein C5S50_01200, partial [Methanosarcinaceae archaeon]|nr:hypothetical protein [Methanosarcinaceae archaeon]
YFHTSDDYISVTDIARFKDSKRTDYIIQNWMRNRNTIVFFGILGRLNNLDFKPIEFNGFRNKAGLNNFILTPRDCRFSPQFSCTQGALPTYFHLYKTILSTFDGFSTFKPNIHPYIPFF